MDRRKPCILNKKNAECFVYVIANKGNRLTFKIGMTNNVTKRFKSLQDNNLNELVLECFIGKMSWDTTKHLESILHRVYKPWNVRGEWFSVSHRDLIPDTLLLECYRKQAEHDENNKRFDNPDLCSKITKESVILNRLFSTT